MGMNKMSLMSYGHFFRKLDFIRRINWNIVSLVIFSVGWAKFENNHILHNAIRHRYLVTTKLISG
jgi:hypothetical protein